MLMALLPLSTFAENITITPMNSSKTYGDADPTEPGDVQKTWFTTSGLPSGVSQENVANALTWYRVTDGENVGTYRYSYEDDATVSTHNLLINGDGQFTIKRRHLKDDFDGTENKVITLELSEPVYLVNGDTQLKPKFKITVDLAVSSVSGDLVEGTDYVITAYGANNTIGPTAGSITIEGKGNYTGSRTLTFEIKGVNIATLAAPQYIGSALTYDATAKTPAATDFKIGDLTPETHFQIKSGSYVNNVNAGTASVTLQGIGDYSGEVVANFTIGKLAVGNPSTFAFSLGTAPKYNGAERAPVLTSATVGGKTLAATDYEWKDLGINAGTYKAKLHFKENGNFSGADQEVEYTIAKQNFTAAAGIAVKFTETTGDPAVEKTDYTYNNEDIKPAFTVTYTVDAEHVYTLPASDYTFEYKDADDGPNLKSVQDSKKLIVTGRGNFESEPLTGKTYNVQKRDLTITTVEFTVGMGADVNPVAKYGTFAKGENASNLGGALVYTYKNNTTSDVYTQETIKGAPVGEYTVQINASGLSPANYNYVVTDGTLHKIAGQVVVKVVDRTIEYGDPFPTSEWTVKHVSGLAEDDPNLATIIAALVQTKFAFVNTPGVVNANAEGYDVNYNGGSIPNDSYAITVLPGKLIVDKKAITASMIQINNGSPLTYTGKAQYPTVNVDIDGFGTPTGLLPTNYYTTEYDESYNAGTRTAKISMSGAGQTNYITETKVYYAAGDPEVVAGTAVAGTLKEVLPYVEKTYDIQKVDLTIKADNFTGDNAWTYGTEEPAYTAKLTVGAAVDGEASLITALLAGEQPEGFNGKLVITRTEANTVGEHAGSLVPSFVDAAGAPVAVSEAATNYAFTLENGDLTIKKGKIIAKVKDITLPYGENAIEGTFQLEAVSGMDKAEAANFDDIVTYEKAVAKFGYTDAYKAIASHTLTYTGTTPTATNYDVVLAEGDAAKGTLTVTKRPVKFKANDKTVAYSGMSPSWETDAKTVNATNIAQDESGEFYSLLGSDNVTTVIESISFTKNVGENDIVLTAKESDIYDITVVNGTLTVTSTGVPPMTLNRVVKASYDDAHTNTAAKLIEQNDGKFVNVKFSDFPMIAEKWYPLVLPFATSVKEVSAAFGYAIVNVFEGLNANGDIKFKLWMGDIPANQPFIVKVYQDMNMADATVVFNNALIENGEPVQGDASSVQFVGTYTGKVDGFRSNEYYFSTNAAYNEYYKGNDTNMTYLRPLGAYFVDNTPNAASESRSIVIEEIDGSTTAIQGFTQDGTSVDAEGWYTLGGVKLQSAPTESGVYIKNGKKVVIK